MIDDATLNNIERLHKLKSDGVISEADFEEAKTRLLQGGKPKAAAVENNQQQHVERRTPVASPSAIYTGSGRPDRMGHPALPSLCRLRREIGA